MAVMEMVALTMIGPESEMRTVAQEMLLTGGFQPLPIDVLVNDRELRSKITTATDNPYDELLDKVASIWEMAGGVLPEFTAVSIDKSFSLSNARYSVDQISKSLETWKSRKRNLVEEKENYYAAKILLESLKDTEYSPEDLAQSEFIIPFFGYVSNDNYRRLIDSSNESPIAINNLAATKDKRWLLVLTNADYEDATRKLLNAVSFKKFSLKTIAEQLNPEDPLGFIERRLDGHRKAINGMEKIAKNTLNENREEYKRLYSQLYTMQRVYDVCKGRGKISDMFLISGWLPASSLDLIKKKVEEDAPNTTLVIEETKELISSGIRVPTMLKNNFLFRAFQEIVAMYSLPSYGEIDPSPIVAISFVLFFGFMFGDVGHGLMIYLASFFMVRSGMMNRSFGFVLKSSAISSIIFGVLYGSVFGLENIIKPLWLSPMHDTNRLIMVAIAVGVFMISLGLFLNIYKQYKDKNYGRLLFDGQGLAGLFLYWSIIGIAAIKMSAAKVPPAFSSTLWGVILLMVLLMVFRDLLSKKFLNQKEEGESPALLIFEILHSLLSFVSNTASFVRLAAFALNHVGLSIAVLMLSDMVHDLPGGIVMKGIIFIAGNILIVGLEGLIVFIQTLRLQYYEFFSKFYLGGGTPFKPMNWKKSSTKYIRDSN